MFAKTQGRTLLKGSLSSKGHRTWSWEGKNANDIKTKPEKCLLYYADEYTAEVRMRSENEKERKKAKKSCEKVLTFRGKFDKIHKLTRAGHRSAALNLENDTDKKKRKIETVIPNELILAG